MGMDYFDDDFSDYFYDGFDEQESAQEEILKRNIYEIDYSVFSSMTDKEKIDYLYYQLRELYYLLFSMNRSSKTRE